MPPVPPPGLTLRDGDWERLSLWVRCSSVRAGLVQRARIVLLAAAGVSDTDIARRVGVSYPTVIEWQARYTRGGIDGLQDEPFLGRPKRVDHVAIIAATLTPPPERLGVTHWSSRLLGTKLNIGNATVARVWREYGLQPWRSQTFRFSTDPMLVARVTDVVGLYLAPPENAVVLCVDAKSQIQALDRTMLAMQTELPERHAGDYLRDGTTMLVAALEVATGKVTATCQPRHCDQDFLRFLREAAHAYPGFELHLVMDSYAADKRVEIRDWLEANPRVHFHFTPASLSWVNLVEVWIGIMEHQAIQRDSYHSVEDLKAKIRTFIEDRDNRGHPFVWTKTTEEDRRQSEPSERVRNGP